jgi:hypothetical protein
MFFIPLSQPESVALVIHALRIAGGQADCSTCPVKRACMQQCLTIATSLDRMIEEGTLPGLSTPETGHQDDDNPAASDPGRSHLKIIK